jgi:hypothetical protein
MTDGARVANTLPHYSLTCARVVDLPGIAVDEEVRRPARYHLLPMDHLSE